MKTLIRDGLILNEGKHFRGSILIEGEHISKIIPTSSPDYTETIRAILTDSATQIIPAEDMYILPGVIDDQVHFREPGATHKGDISTESAAAALGGVTSFMDMPNNTPPTTTLELLEEKYRRGAETSTTNYSFYIGATNDNLDQLLQIDPQQVCGVKVFMGSSTGNMLVDNTDTLESLFSKCPTIIATHCEDEKSIREGLTLAQSKYGEDIPPEEHPNIRSAEACIKSTQKAVELAIKHQTRLHILHVSTAEEVEIIKKGKEQNPNITFEVCAHYLWFCDEDYKEFGTLIKCNPAIKRRSDMEALRRAVAACTPGAVATDHAPHLISEKNNRYISAPSGLPTVQHSLRMMLQLAKERVFPLEIVPQMMSHSPADTFRIKNRGYLREGYYADIAIVKDIANHSENHSVAYKCGWTPILEEKLDFQVIHTFVNGKMVVHNSALTGIKNGKRLEFN